MDTNILDSTGNSVIKEIPKLKINNLSHIASNLAPKFEEALNFLANLPSIASLIEPIPARTIATIGSPKIKYSCY